MAKKIEIVDGIKGEWRNVTRAEEVKVGQRVRYGGCKIGYNGMLRIVERIYCGSVDTWDGKDQSKGASDVLNYPAFKGTVQAFFQLPKIAKVEVFGRSNRFGWTSLSFKTAILTSRYEYSSRTSAIRGARRFCKTIGFECEIVK